MAQLSEWSEDSAGSVTGQISGRQIGVLALRL